MQGGSLVLRSKLESEPGVHPFIRDFRGPHAGPGDAPRRLLVDPEVEFDIAVVEPKDVDEADLRFDGAVRRPPAAEALGLRFDAGYPPLRRLSRRRANPALTIPPRRSCRRDRSDSCLPSPRRRAARVW